MLSKSQVSLLKSLQQKKHRKDNGLFLAEGYKSVVEFTGSRYVIEAIYYTPDFDPKVLKLSQKINLCEISPADMARISSFKTPPPVIATIKIPPVEPLAPNTLTNKFSLVLDGIQDPGNLGTIIRTADWFGIENIICSADSVDAYNPKTIQASMGSLARICITYTPVAAFLTSCDLPVYGAVLDGASVYETSFNKEGLILLGSEGSGLSEAVKKLITKAITIPGIGGAESLNVGVAAAIICSEVYRKSFDKIAGK